MKLVGMLDSPYVRRVAISLQLLGLPFEHRPLSVFGAFDTFARLNPVVKAPTLVCDDGTVLMDSSLILQYAEALATPRSLLPTTQAALRHDLRLTGLALAACEKAVQLIYERELRPPERRHAPWVERITGQLVAAAREIECELALAPPRCGIEDLTQGGVDVAVAWHFTSVLLPGMLSPVDHPSTARFSAMAESLAPFRRAPHGDGAMSASV
jgi:glutathione S-transferase